MVGRHTTSPPPMELPELKSVTTHFVDLEARIIRMEEEIRLLKSDRSYQKGNLATELSDNITAVVGIKEMLTKRRRIMKWIWAILFTLGMLATAYYVYQGVKEYSEDRTVTNVELRRKRSYPYPTLVLCPGGGWVDAEKAYAEGLSKEALRYAVGYLDIFVTDSALNVTNARREFQEFYNAHNYSSLLDFYRNMTVEPVHTESMGELFKLNGPGFVCEGCVSESPMEKVIVKDLMCYSFKFNPAEARYVNVNDRPQLIFQMKNVDNGIIQYTPNWFAYLTTNARILQPQFYPMAIEQFTVNTLKTNLMNFDTLENKERKCLKAQDVPKNYSADRCAIRCLHDLIQRETGCGVLEYTTFDEFEPPAHYCNYFEPVPKMNNTGFREFQNLYEDGIRKSEAGANCVKSCPHSCDRQIFTSTFDTKFPISLDADGVTENARKKNLSMVVIRIDHQAISQDGVMTLTEVSTYSFATLISNIGGTLGMFVGGTVLTFFQIILWAIDYCLDYRSRRKKIVQDKC